MERIKRHLRSAAGYLLSLFFETAYAHSHMVRNSMKVIVVLGVSFLLMSIEPWLKPVVSVSGLLAVVKLPHSYWLELLWISATP